LEFPSSSASQEQSRLMYSSILHVLFAPFLTGSNWFIRMSRFTTTECCTELYQNGVGCTVARRRDRTICRFILQKCLERNIVSSRKVGKTLWGQVRTEAIGHSTLQGCQAKFNSLLNGPYILFHVAQDSLIIDMLKKAAESRWRVRLNSDDE